MVEPHLDQHLTQYSSLLSPTELRLIQAKNKKMLVFEENIGGQKAGVPQERLIFL